MVPDIEPPTWLPSRGTETFVFTSEKEIARCYCLFVKYVTSSIPGSESFQETEGRAPGMMVPLQGSMDDLDPRLRDFVRKMACIVGLHGVAVHENYMIINPNEPESPQAVINAVDDLIRETWNIIEVDASTFDEIVEAAEEEEWPDLIG
jgi:hypothetical protein